MAIGVEAVRNNQVYLHRCCPPQLVPAKRKGQDPSMVLIRSAYQWDFATLQFRRSFELRPFEPARLRHRTGRYGFQGQESNMQRSMPSAYRLFRAAESGGPVPPEAAETARTRIQRQPPRRRARELAAAPPLAPYQRCTCGSCRECRDNARWDRIFAKFEVKETEERPLYGCALVDL